MNKSQKKSIKPTSAGGIRNAEMGTNARPPLRIPLPKGVIEHISVKGEGVAGNLWSSVVGLKDGSLLLARANHLDLKPGDKVPSVASCSMDGGKTWSNPKPFPAPFGILGLIRLRNGDLAACGEIHHQDGSQSLLHFARSSDDGKTWTEPVQIPAYPNFYMYLQPMLELEDGRILLAGYWERNCGRPDTGASGSPDCYVYSQYGWGYWKGRVMACDGHRGPEMSMAIVFLSDDQGNSWKHMTQQGIFGWFDEKGIPNGERGIIDVCEPAIAETRDGRIIMLLRSKTGRLLQTFSRDHGNSWLSVLPSELAASQTTPQIARIPHTGDLLCVWNQTSNEEIRRGFQRGRLSTAISKDDGRTWDHFKTIELQSGMCENPRIEPEFPISCRVVARAFMGDLPDDFMHFTQPVLDIVNDQVFLRYGRAWLVPKGRKNSGVWPQHWPTPEDNEAAWESENVLRIYPYTWFYQK